MFYKRLCVALFVFIIGVTGVALYLFARLSASENFNAQIALEEKCSIWAATFYKTQNYADTSQGILSYYKNHWNRKTNTCFIQVNSVASKDDNLIIDVFNPLDSKRYAAYDGHQTCDQRYVAANKCMLDSGSIWLDGDDSRPVPDYRVGFAGVGSGKVGDNSTQKQFLDQIHGFMND